MFDIFYFDQKPNIFAHEQKVNSLDEAIALSKTRYFWIVEYLSDYSGVDFIWEPVPWESQFIHAWPSQWQQDGGTYLVPKNYDDAGVKYHEDGVIPRTKNSVIYFIDHYDQNIEKAIQSTNIADTGKYEITRYASNYLNTLRRIAKRAQGTYKHIWVCSSVCDYTDFDFSWHPEKWQSDMVHAFPSDEQKFGDTFYIPVDKFLEQSDVELLDWYEINFIDDVSVPRWPIPVVNHEYDNQVDAVKNNSNIDAPLSLYSNNESTITNIPTISLWREQTKTIIPLSSGASQVIIPRDAGTYITEQLYDYPYIDKSFNNITIDTPLDIVFISNGESNAEENWNRLLESTKYINNRVTRVDGNNGRVAAYQAALSESNTDWAFCVFAKLEISLDFDWAWQPDRLQERKHYIFNAKNPVNGLEYGHMAMIAYNKKLVLENDGSGLDFTLSQKHTTVPLLSGVARFNSDPWMTWRTAFRECLKLRNDADNIESEYRLEKWLTVADGNNGEWSTAGAKDAIDFYNAVSGDYENLRLSYEWQWLREYYDSRYS